MRRIIDQRMAELGASIPTPPSPPPPPSAPCSAAELAWRPMPERDAKAREREHVRVDHHAYGADRALKREGDRDQDRSRDAFARDRDQRRDHDAYTRDRDYNGTRDSSYHSHRDRHDRHEHARHDKRSSHDRRAHPSQNACSVSVRRDRESGGDKLLVEAPSQRVDRAEAWEANSDHRSRDKRRISDH
jgi:hypothetical protein